MPEMLIGGDKSEIFGNLFFVFLKAFYKKVKLYLVYFHGMAIYISIGRLWSQFSSKIRVKVDH